jgi:hypothetical protein
MKYWCPNSCTVTPSVSLTPLGMFQTEPAVMKVGYSMPPEFNPYRGGSTMVRLR